MANKAKFKVTVITTMEVDVDYPDGKLTNLLDEVIDSANYHFAEIGEINSVSINGSFKLVNVETKTSIG